MERIPQVQNWAIGLGARMLDMPQFIYTHIFPNFRFLLSNFFLFYVSPHFAIQGPHLATYSTSDPQDIIRPRVLTISVMSSKENVRSSRSRREGSSDQNEAKTDPRSVCISSFLIRKDDTLVGTSVYINPLQLKRTIVSLDQGNEGLGRPIAKIQVEIGVVCVHLTLTSLVYISYYTHQIS